MEVSGRGKVRRYAERGERGGRKENLRGKERPPPKRGTGATPSAERARHNRARNLEDQKRKQAYLKRVSQGIETTAQVVSKRETRVGEPDSAEYLARRAEHDQFLTIYGRKTVREALRDKSIKFRHIHMDEKVIAVNSNVKRSEADPVVLEILDLIRERNIPLIPTDKMRISYMSKNGKQDGGIVADLHAPQGSKLNSVDDFLAAKQSNASQSSNYLILALDQITTPANMGMIIRSCVASLSFDALLVGAGSVPVTNPLVIKSSASSALIPAKNSLPNPADPSPSHSSNMVFVGAKDGMFRALSALKEDGAQIVLLAAQQRKPSRMPSQDIPSVSLWDFKPSNKCVFVIGGESQGHDPAVELVSNYRVHIPMSPGVESLNVAVTASLVAFAPHLRRNSL